MFCVADQGSGGVASLDTRNAMLVKALLSARDILLEELQKIGKAVNEALDLSEFVSIVSNMKQENPLANEVVGQGKPQNGLKVLAFISRYRLQNNTSYLFILF